MNGTIFCCTQDPGRHGWGSRPGGIAMSSRTNRTHQTHFVPDCQGALAGMGVKRDKEEKVMCHGAAGTDTRILKKQVCPSRDEQDERTGGLGSQPGRSRPSIPGARCRLYYPWFDFDPVSFVRRGGARRRRREGTRTTRRIDNEGIKANCFYLQQKLRFLSIGNFTKRVLESVSRCLTKWIKNLAAKYIVW